MLVLNNTHLLFKCLGDTCNRLKLSQTIYMLLFLFVLNVDKEDKTFLRLVYTWSCKLYTRNEWCTRFLALLHLRCTAGTLHDCALNSRSPDYNPKYVWIKKMFEKRYRVGFLK